MNVNNVQYYLHLGVDNGIVISQCITNAGSLLLDSWEPVYSKQTCLQRTDLSTANKPVYSE